LPLPHSLGQGQCCQPPTPGIMMVCCLFFNFVGLFDFGCCSLAQEMIFVIYYLPCFREWFITHSVLAFLHFQYFFTDSLQRLAPCPIPLLWCTLKSYPSAVLVLVYSLLFIVQLFVCLFLQGGSFCPGGCADLSWRWLGEFHVTHGAHLFGLQNVSQAYLELVAVAAHKFSRCNMAWRSFPGASGSQC
jgi:hypothetical protein